MSLSSKTDSVFEILAAYATDTLFNHIYGSACVSKGAGDSLRDEYARCVKAYVVGVKTDRKCYASVAQGMHRFFMNATRYSTLGYADFVDQVVGVCVPEEFFGQLSSSDKDELLCSVVCDLVSSAGVAATTPDMLARIVDGHARAPGATVRALQDLAVSALIAKRSTLHNQFLKKVGQVRDVVSTEALSDMRQAIQRLVMEKTAEAARANLAEKVAFTLKARLDQTTGEYEKSRGREVKLRKVVDLLRLQGAPETDAAARMSIPRREWIAEPRTVARSAGPPPRRDVIAESEEAPATPTTPATHDLSSFFKVRPVAVGLPASKLGGLPASKLVGLPASKLGGLPASKLGGFPVGKPAGLPASKLGGLSASKQSGFPAKKQSGLPASKQTNELSELSDMINELDDDEEANSDDDDDDGDEDDDDEATASGSADAASSSAEKEESVVKKSRGARSLLDAED